MTAILADVIRLEVPTQAEITGGTPPAVKLKQQIHAKNTGNFYYKDSDGNLILFFAAKNLSAQDSASLGSALIGDVGIPGVTPSGGSPGSAANLHNMLLGFKDYVTAVTSSVALVNLFPSWDIFANYSQNDIVVWRGPDDGPYYLAISNVPGDETNTGNDPVNDDPEFWTNYTEVFPLAQVLTMILNTKANAV